MTDDELEQFYRETFPIVARSLQRIGAGLHDAKDAFHDALIIFLEKSRAGLLDIQISEKAYVAGIARIVWIQKNKRDNLLRKLDGPLAEDLAIFLDDEQAISEEREKSAFEYLSLAGKKCMEILRSFYYDDKPLSEIASRFGFSGIRSATVQKYKCIEKIRAHLKKNEHHAARIS